MTLDGLHCESCEIKVENALNRIDGVLAKVERKKRRATVSFSKEVSDETLKERVERLRNKSIYTNYSKLEKKNNQKKLIKFKKNN